MAKEQNETRTRAYRKKNPADVAEAKFISGLIDKFVADSTAQLAQAGQLDELHVLMNYRKTWRGIVADLTEQDEPPAASMESAKLGDDVAPGTHADASAGAGSSLHEAANSATEGGTQKTRTPARNKA